MPILILFFITECRASCPFRFGLRARVQTVLDELHSMTLPCPALALLWPETVQTNFEILSQRFNVVPGVGTRNLSSMAGLQSLLGWSLCMFVRM